MTGFSFLGNYSYNQHPKFISSLEDNLFLIHMCQITNPACSQHHT